MTTFQSIAEFKRAAWFYPAGRIIPVRVIQAPKKMRPKLVFGSDSWVLPSPTGHTVLCDRSNGRSSVIVKNKDGQIYPCSIRSKAKPIAFHGSPYSSGETEFISMCATETETLYLINESRKP